MAKKDPDGAGWCGCHFRCFTFLKFPDFAAALEESAQNDVGKVVRRQEMHFQWLQQASLPTSRWLKAELHGSMCLESYCRFLVGSRVSVPGKSSLVFVGWSFFGQIESLGTSLVHLGRRPDDGDHDFIPMVEWLGGAQLTLDVSVDLCDCCLERDIIYILYIYILTYILRDYNIWYILYIIYSIGRMALYSENYCITWFQYIPIWFHDVLLGGSSQ